MHIWRLTSQVNPCDLFYTHSGEMLWGIWHSSYNSNITQSCFKSFIWRDKCPLLPTFGKLYVVISLLLILRHRKRTFNSVCLFWMCYGTYKDICERLNFHWLFYEKSRQFVNQWAIKLPPFYCRNIWFNELQT